MWWTVKKPQIAPFSSPYLFPYDFAASPFQGEDDFFPHLKSGLEHHPSQWMLRKYLLFFAIEDRQCDVGFTFLQNERPHGKGPH